MDLANNTVLITGGASGIGLALAEIYLEAGSQVIICGRRKDALEEAKRKHPTLITKECDIANESERVDLVQWIKHHHPHVNVFVNNAGIQQRLVIGEESFWEKAQQELTTNLLAPLHLSSLMVSHLRSVANAYIINVTSGLSFVPLANVPVYCTTKAAMHSFTLSLRHQIKKFWD